jgi:hypothetical protein
VLKPGGGVVLEIKNMLDRVGRVDGAAASARSRHCAVSVMDHSQDRVGLVQKKSLLSTSTQQATTSKTLAAIARSM